MAEKLRILFFFFCFPQRKKGPGIWLFPPFRLILKPREKGAVEYLCVFTVSGVVGLSTAVMYGWTDPLGYRGARRQSLSEDPEAREMALKQWNRKRMQKKL